MHCAAEPELPGQRRRFKARPIPSSPSLPVPPPERKLHSVAGEDVDVRPRTARPHDAATARHHRSHPQPHPGPHVVSVHRPRTRTCAPRLVLFLHPASHTETPNHIENLTGGSPDTAVAPSWSLRNHPPLIHVRIILFHGGCAGGASRYIDPTADHSRRELLAREDGRRTEGDGAGQRVVSQSGSSTDNVYGTAHGGEAWLGEGACGEVRRK
ncbi:hypothetical protein IEQ34_012234 [Dendrobium chrysotoxum]|uniref:Uncharacterized protein n=1 Tax=Dendrobium chrysotoxum TaxID=161865 RepID=A0AAV7GCB7_DENCH|nr:hypothetical protein IEQ34_012234 [Dendrobium chrysotoxum]